MPAASADALGDLPRLLRREPRAGALLAVATTCSVLAGACTSGLLALAHHEIDLPALEPWRLALFLALWVGHGALGVVSVQALARLVHGVLHGVRQELAARLLEAPAASLEAIGRDRALAAFTQVTTALGYALEDMPSLLSRGAVLAGLFAYMAWGWPRLFVLVLALVALGTLVCVLPARGVGRTEAARLDADRAQLGVFSALVSGWRELLQSWRARRALLSRHLRPSGERTRDATVASLVQRELHSRWQEMFGMLGLGLLVFAMPAWGQASRQEVASFLLILFFALGPLTTLARFLFRYQALRAALDQLDALGVELGRPVAGPPAEPPPLLPPGAAPFPLELRAVRLARPGHADDLPFTLGPLSLRCDGPELLFVTGGNGSGKSTLARVLCGLYPPDEGTLAVAGVEVTPALRERYRELVSVVHSDFHLFDVLLGREDDPAAHARATALLERLDLSRRVRVEGGGRFSTTELSQGQRKRLALAAALLEDRPILVFDEWAADQDPGWKRTFYRELLPELRARGKLAIIVTHDDSHFAVADRIAHLEDGRLVRVAAPAREVAAC